ncbi:hypothetical protein E1B28_007748 [Marasmius oreades]|uniref:Uncharacterized protein n=1 Tax=Marasmius oreades TaxID=181124 RepID=A0A9P7S292_9AGAR|nr:uncharacterized protein E1B28_007748 [Marasmius oreades]KAG7094136.1 hypothetical protein E1B28_007748 [Marasmius oreades]
MASVLEDILAPFLSAESIITQTISTVAVTFFIYGIYCVVFGLSIRVLIRRNSRAHKLYTGCSIALFVLATIYTAVKTWGALQQALNGFRAVKTKDYLPFVQYLEGNDGEAAWVGTSDMISTLMNSIADTMLIHRCYVLFNYNKFILFPLAFIAFVLNGIDLGCIITITTGLGTSSKPLKLPIVLKAYSIDHDALIGIVVFQIVLALITGGRIWWITRQTRQMMVGSIHSRYNDIVAIIIESALLYAGILLAAVVLEDVLDPFMTGVFPFDIPVVPSLMSGLAPTMVIARIAYGKAVDNLNVDSQTVSTFRAASGQTPSQQMSDAGMGRAAIQFHLRMDGTDERV